MTATDAVLAFEVRPSRFWINVQVALWFRRLTVFIQWRLTPAQRQSTPRDHGSEEK